MMVGQKIKQYIEKKNISQTAFSIDVKMATPKLNLILNGHRKLQLEEYVRFCDALGVSYDTFLKKKEK